MRTDNYCNLFILITLLWNTTLAYSQSMLVIGGEQSVRDCYMAATLAAQLHRGSEADIQTCTDALENTSMTLKNMVATYVNRGVIHVSLEKYKEAIDDYETAFKMDPNAGEIYVNRGNLYFLGQVYTRAIAEYSRAIELGVSQNHITYFNRGMAYEKMGEYKKAEADYRSAIEIAPQWYRPQEKLKKILNKKMNS